MEFFTTPIEQEDVLLERMISTAQEEEGYRFIDIRSKTVELLVVFRQCTSTERENSLL